MKAFSEFVQQFYTWSKEINYENNSANNSQYIWEIPIEALDNWKYSLDAHKEQFTEYTLSMYRDMFQVGKQIVGITVGCTSDDNYVRLHKLTQKTVNWSFTKVLCSDKINILEQNEISRNIVLSTEKEVELPIVINAHTMKTNNTFDLVDLKINTLGTCIGEKYKLLIRGENRLDVESWLATIDYANGDFALIRSNIDNEEKFIRYYDLLTKMINSIGTRTIATAAGGSVSVQTIGFVANNITPYDYVSPSGTIEVLTGPGEVMFTWDIND